jgi:hypothetical protein
MEGEGIYCVVEAQQEKKGKIDSPGYPHPREMQSVEKRL